MNEVKLYYLERYAFIFFVQPGLSEQVPRIDSAIERHTNYAGVNGHGRTSVSWLKELNIICSGYLLSTRVIFLVLEMDNIRVDQTMYQPYTNQWRTFYRYT